MKIVVLDGYAANPGDLSWAPLEALGELTVYDRTPADQIAARIADAGYRKMMESKLIGLTERQAAAIAEGECRNQGAEAVIFTVFGSGNRTHRIIGRPEEKVIEDGDMIMCALAIQYEGYVSTYNLPFAVGNCSEETKRVIDVLIHASAAGLPYLKGGEPMKNFVSAVRNYFREAGLAEYDLSLIHI